jgi:hypothetical protein
VFLGKSKKAIFITIVTKIKTNKEIISLRLSLSSIYLSISLCHALSELRVEDKSMSWLWALIGPNTMEPPLIFFQGGAGGDPPWKDTARWARRTAAS